MCSYLHNYFYLFFPYQSYERRSKSVKLGTKEAKYWSDVSAEMMSEEQKVADKYIRHPPLYRSQRLNEFVDKLDHRLSKCLSDRPRISRILGSPHKPTPPMNAKKWTITAHSLSRKIFDNHADPTGDEEQNEDFDGEQLTSQSSDSEFSAGDSE